MIIKMIILRLLGSSDDKKKEKIGVSQPMFVTESSSCKPCFFRRTAVQHRSWSTPDEEFALGWSAGFTEQFCTFDWVLPNEESQVR